MHLGLIMFVGAECIKLTHGSTKWKAVVEFIMNF
jgi:hypothetical protein